MPIIDQYNSLNKRIKLFFAIIKKNRKTAQRYIKLKTVAYYTTERKQLTPYELYMNFIDSGVSHEIALKCISDARQEFVYTNTSDRFAEAVKHDHNSNIDYYNSVVTEYNSKYKT